MIRGITKAYNEEQRFLHSDLYRSLTEDCSRHKRWNNLALPMCKADEGDVIIEIP